MTAVYAKVHRNEKIHRYMELGLKEVMFPEELRTILDSGRYDYDLRQFYADSCEGQLIIEPHSSNCDIDDDFFIGFSGVDSNVFSGFREKTQGIGMILDRHQPIKRIVLEVIVKPDEDEEKKLRLFSGVFSECIKELVK